MRPSHRASSSCLLVLGALLLGGVVASAASAQSGDLAQLHELEKRERITRHRARLMPAPMPANAIAAWAELLVLDDDQQELLSELQTQYAIRVARLDTTHRNRIVALWPAAFDYSRVQRRVIPVANPQLLELHDEYGELLNKLLAADQALFSPLRSVLNLEQSLALRRVEVARFLSFVDVPTDLPEARVDVGRIVAELGLDEDVQQVAEAALATYYEQLVDQLVSAVVPGSRDVMLNRARLLVAAGPRWELTASVEQLAGFRNSWTRLDQSEANLWKRLALTHFDGVDRLAPRLSNEKRTELRSLYHLAIWPELFEEQQEALAYAAQMREWLPQDDETTTVLLDRAAEGLMKSLSQLTRDEVEARFSRYTGRSVSDVGPGRASRDQSGPGAVGLVLDEIAWFEFRLKQRDAIERFSATLIGLNRIHRPEDLVSIRQYRESLEARSGADQHRVNSLKRLLEELQEQAPAARDEP